MNARTPAQFETSPDSQALPRLLRADPSSGETSKLPVHLERWGPLDLPWIRRSLLSDLDRSGLVGHGGAWFPVATKWRDVSSRRRRPVVVANGAEGEPTSRKDRLLLSRTPHLVLDGASCAATALDAAQVVIYVPHDLVATVEAAIVERRRHQMDPVDLEVVASPPSFIAGQESSVVNYLNGRHEGPAPSFTAVRSIRERGVNGRPTLVHNVETLCHVALIARFGSTWFRSLGTDESPGTMLLTVTGRWEGPTVVEAEPGTSMTDVLSLPPVAGDIYQAALLGGYGGAWVTLEELQGLRLSERAARQAKASLGPGIVVLLPKAVCPVAEVARIARYMAGQGAGQCGPCVNGLADLSDTLGVLARGTGPRSGGLDEVLELCALVEGRGACRHPDGVARFVSSACRVFQQELGAHLSRRGCRHGRHAPFLPVPASAATLQVRR